MFHQHLSTARILGSVMRCRPRRASQNSACKCNSLNIYLTFDSYTGIFKCLGIGTCLSNYPNIELKLLHKFPHLIFSFADYVIHVQYATISIPISLHLFMNKKTHTHIHTDRVYTNQHKHENVLYSCINVNKHAEENAASDWP